MFHLDSHTTNGASAKQQVDIVLLSKDGEIMIVTCLVILALFREVGRHVKDGK